MNFFPAFWVGLYRKKILGPIFPYFFTHELLGYSTIRFSYSYEKREEKKLAHTKSAETMAEMMSPWYVESQPQQFKERERERERESGVVKERGYNRAFYTAV